MRQTVGEVHRPIHRIQVPDTAICSGCLAALFGNDAVIRIAPLYFSDQQAFCFLVHICHQVNRPLEIDMFFTVKSGPQNCTGLPGKVFQLR